MLPTENDLWPVCFLNHVQVLSGQCCWRDHRTCKLLNSMSNDRTVLKSGPWSSLVIAGILGRTLQSNFSCQPEPLQVLITQQHHIEMYFSGPYHYRQRIVNIIQIRYVKPPKCLQLGRGVCMCKICTSVLPVLLLGHTLNDHSSLSGSVCSATAMFSFHTFSVVFHYVLLTGVQQIGLYM